MTSHSVKAHFDSHASNMNATKRSPLPSIFVKDNAKQFEKSSFPQKKKVASQILKKVASKSRILGQNNHEKKLRNPVRTEFWCSIYELLSEFI